MRGHHQRNKNYRGNSGANIFLPVEQSATQSGTKLASNTKLLENNSNLVLGPRQTVNHIQTIVRNRNPISHKVASINNPYLNPDE